jgi:regulator of sigma E protease
MAERRRRQGIRIGDRIVGFDGKENPTWQRIENDSKISPERAVPIVVERNGQRMDLSITPSREEFKGNVVGSLDMGPTELVVLSPQPGSLAEAAGIQKGDKALSINGVTVTGIKSFIDVVQETKGEPIKLTVIRNNQPTDVTVQAKDDGSGQYRSEPESAIKVRTKKKQRSCSVPHLPSTRISRSFG